MPKELPIYHYQKLYNAGYIQLPALLLLFPLLVVCRDFQPTPDQLHMAIATLRTEGFLREEVS